jgi:tetratricopeptide (TPR) repeat protein
MKPYLMLLLFELCTTLYAFSQDILQELVVERTYTSTKFYREAGCTPRDGALVFDTTIPDLEFSMPDTPDRLLRVSDYDAKNNCYVLCVMPTENEVPGSPYTQYSIQIAARGYKTEEAYFVSDINAGIAQHFMIDPQTSSSISTEKEENNLQEEVLQSIEQMPFSEDMLQKTPVTFSYSSLNWYIKGERNRVAENYSEAIPCYRNALDIDPSLLDAWNGLASVYYQQGNYTEAIECYKQVAENFLSATVWSNMGICYQHLQDYDNAMDCFQKSNTIVNNGSAWYGMGICYAKKKNHSKSMECMKKAAQLEHKDAQELLMRMNKKWQEKSK